MGTKISLVDEGPKFLFVGKCFLNSFIIYNLYLGASKVIVFRRFHLRTRTSKCKTPTKYTNSGNYCFSFYSLLLILHFQ
jgi:hypothetical protein